jgi:hypothetical protein
MNSALRPEASTSVDSAVFFRGYFGV